MIVDYHTYKTYVYLIPYLTYVYLIRYITNMTPNIDDNNKALIVDKIDELQIKLAKLRELRNNLIRQEYKEGKTVSEISRRYKMKHPNVSVIIRGGQGA